MNKHLGSDFEDFLNEVEEEQLWNDIHDAAGYIFDYVYYRTGSEVWFKHIDWDDSFVIEAVFMPDWTADYPIIYSLWFKYTNFILEKGIKKAIKKWPNTKELYIELMEKYNER